MASKAADANAKTATSGQPKKNFLQKFMGKVTGREKKEAEAAVVPPVPPGYKEPAQARPTDAPRRIAATPNNQTPTSERGQNSMAAGAAQHSPRKNFATRPGETSVAGQSINTGRPSQNEQGAALPGRPTGKTATPVSTAGQPLAQVPFLQQNASAFNSDGTVENGSGRAPLDAPRFLQPGAAPSFMAGSGLTAVPGQEAATTPPAAGQPESALNAAKEVIDETSVAADNAATSSHDDFEMPFADVEDPSEVLDLDAVNAAVPNLSDTIVQDAVSSQNARLDSTTTSTEAAPTVTKPEFAERAEVEEVAKEASTSDRAGEDDVSINAGVPLPPVDADDNETFGDAAPPMQDFTDSLPSISVSAEDVAGVASMDSSDSVVLPPVDLPNENSSETDPATAVTSSSTDSASTTASPSAIDVTETTPAQSVDAERLQQTAEQERLLRQQRQIQARADQPGFKGFCPVTLRDKRELVDADPSLTGTFGLQTYTFATEEAKAAFEADPSRYAPAAGGSDIVLLVNSGEEQPGMLDYALWYRDRLYMFRSRETMAAFSQDPQRFANQY
ncbi:MAG: hypothetical protein ACK58L_07810 [Planctomycetota bacterium]